MFSILSDSKSNPKMRKFNLITEQTNWIKTRTRRCHRLSRYSRWDNFKGLNYVAYLVAIFFWALLVHWECYFFLVYLVLFCINIYEFVYRRDYKHTPKTHMPQSEHGTGNSQSSCTDNLTLDHGRLVQTFILDFHAIYIKIIFCRSRKKSDCFCFTLHDIRVSYLANSARYGAKKPRRLARNCGQGYII